MKIVYYIIAYFVIQERSYIRQNLESVKEHNKEKLKEKEKEKGLKKKVKDVDTNNENHLNSNCDSEEDCPDEVYFSERNPFNLNFTKVDRPDYISPNAWEYDNKRLTIKEWKNDGVKYFEFQNRNWYHKNYMLLKEKVEVENESKGDGDAEETNYNKIEHKESIYSYLAKMNYSMMTSISSSELPSVSAISYYNQRARKWLYWMHLIQSRKERQYKILDTDSKRVSNIRTVSQLYSEN